MTIRFSYPEYFLVFSLLLLIIPFYGYVINKQKKQIDKLVSSNLQLNILPEYSLRKRKIQFLGYLLAFSFIILGLAEPRIGYKIKIKEQSENVILLDLSNSMLAQNGNVRRIDLGKQLAKQLIQKSENTNFALVVFAANAFKLTPSTGDKTQLYNYLENISVNYMPVQGTDMNAALNTAINSFAIQKGNRTITLISDAENHESSIEPTLLKLKSDSIKLNLIAIGTEQGAIIGSGKSAKKDKKGKVVVSKPDFQLMKKWAEISDGNYIEIKGTEISESIINSLIKSQQQNEKTSTKIILKDSRFDWFYLLAIFTILITYILSEKRGSLFIFQKKVITTLLILFAYSINTNAQLTENKLRKGVEYFKNEKYQLAESEFEDYLKKNPENEFAQFNKALTLSKLAKINESKQVFEKLITAKNSKIKAESYYCIGNIFLIQKNYQLAIEQYKSSLKINDQNPNAKYNLLYALKKIEKDKPPLPPPPPNTSPPPQQTKGIKNEKKAEAQKVKQLQQNSSEIKRAIQQNEFGSKAGNEKDW